MDKSPVTDKDINVPPLSHGNRFRELRARAKEVGEKPKYKKLRRDKRPREYKYKIGDVFVAVKESYRNSPYFYLVEVLDYAEGEGEWSYYCILQRTTDPDLMDRIGRLVHVREHDNGWWRGGRLADANVENKNIKWLVTE